MDNDEKKIKNYNVSPDEVSPKPTAPIIIENSVFMGDMITIFLSPNVEHLHHTLKYEFANSSGIIYEEVVDDVDWEIPSSLSQLIPFKDEGILRVIVDTYDGEMLIGSEHIDVVAKKRDELTQHTTPSIDDKIIVYDKFDVYFESPLAIIDTAKDVSISEKLNSEFDMSMTVAYDGKSDYIVADNYVQVVGDIFKIRKVKRSRNSDGINLSIQAEHLYFELLDDYIEEADRLTLYPHELAEYINNYTRFNIQVDDEVRNNRHDFPRRRITISRGSPIKTINRMLATWGLDIDRYRRTVTVKSNMNKDKIQLFKHQKNLPSLEREDNGGQLTTRLFLIGNEGLSIQGLRLAEIEYPTRTSGDETTIFSEDGAILGKVKSSDGVITSKYIDSKYVDTYPAPRNGEIVEGEIYEKIDLLLEGIERINILDSVSNSYTLDVEELKRTHGDIEKFGLGYTALLQDEELLAEYEYSLIESRIIEYTHYPFESDKTSKVRLGTEKDGVLDFLGSVEEVRQKVEENSDSWDKAVEKTEMGLELHWDSNENSIEISRRETEIASLEIDLAREGVGQGQILVNLMSDSDSLFIIRVYDNETQQLYSPIISQIKRGYNTISIPHAYVKVREGSHSFSITAQSKDGVSYIQPRGVTYDIEVIGADVRHLDLQAEDISIRQTHGNSEPTDIYLIGTNLESEFPMVYTAPYVHGRLYSENDFSPLWTLDSLLNVRNLLVEFNGVFELHTGDNTYSLTTQSKPWIFWIDEYDELWAQYGDEVNNRQLVAEGVLQASAIKGWTMQGETQNDMGLVVAYVKYDGYVAYRQLVGLSDMVGPSNLQWTPERQLTEAGSGNTAVQVNRLNDYRLAFSVQGIDKIFVSGRMYVGQATPKEYVRINTTLDDWMTIFTAMPVDDIIEDLHPVSTTEDNRTFKLTAPYKWNLRGDRNRAIEVITNGSGVDIQRIYISENDPYSLMVVMNEEITRGELIVRANARHLLGKLDNNTDVDLNIDITVFEVILRVQETVELQTSLANAEIEVTQKQDLEFDISETVEIRPGVVESNIDVIQIEKIYLNKEGVVNLKVDVDMELDVYKYSEINP